MKYYGQKACEGFAYQAAHALGVSAAFAVGPPSTDGTTVYLQKVPSGKGFAEPEFRRWCATVWHELAHVKFQTATRHRSFASANKARFPNGLAAFAYNVVADLADEARLPAQLVVTGRSGAARGAAMLLRERGDWATDMQWRSGMMSPGSQRGAAAGMAALCANLVFAKGSPGHRAIFNAWYHWRRHVPSLPQIVKAARPARRAPTKAWKGRGRTSADWKRLERMAVSLAELLLPIWPQNANEAPRIDPFGSIPLPVAFAPSDEEAGQEEGEEYALMRNGDSPTVPASSGSGSGGEGVRDDEPEILSPEKIACFRRGIASAVERMRVSSDGGRDSGAPMGRFTRPVRSCTDGLAFSAPVVDRENDRVSACVLLDRSASIRKNGGYGNTAMIADALAAELEKASEVARMVFGEFPDTPGATDRQPRIVECFARSGKGGGTPTALALALAHDVLRGKPGRRYAVVVTDGIANDRSACAQECARLVRSGVVVLCIALRCFARTIGSTMPGAHVVAADDLATLCAGLAMFASRMESQA